MRIEFTYKNPWYHDHKQEAQILLSKIENQILDECIVSKCHRKLNSDKHDLACWIGPIPSSSKNSIGENHWLLVLNSCGDGSLMMSSMGQCWIFTWIHRSTNLWNLNENKQKNSVKSQSPNAHSFFSQIPTSSLLTDIYFVSWRKHIEAVNWEIRVFFCG